MWNINFFSPEDPKMKKKKIPTFSNLKTVTQIL